MKRQLISAERYEELVALGTLKAREVRDYLLTRCRFCSSGLPCGCEDSRKRGGEELELSNEELNKISTIAFILIGEVLTRHGPGLQNHDGGLRAAYDRIIDRAKALGVTDHPGAAQQTEAGEALGGAPEGTSAVEGGGSLDPPRPVVPGDAGHGDSASGPSGLRVLEAEGADTDHGVSQEDAGPDERSGEHQGT